jgi:hypothetical protein
MIIGDYRYSKISGDYNGDIIWLMIGSGIILANILGIII